MTGRKGEAATLAAVAAGGAAGAVARYALTEAFPHPPGAFAWATFGINVCGCLLIGVLMVLITEVRRAHPLVRPFLGVGVLGGFTTFSTYIADVREALAAGHPLTAAAYLAGTLVAALAAVTAGVLLTRALFRRRS
ncbi:fluoride efflux transporter FluC [Spongiactinospora sp. 9N601]|uniref:fluoride efflux transporter FluC n=1 Tax=Spongiactinospora sp. 9N601 TaxID=3375149 RepID=UPI00378E9D20